MALLDTTRAEVDPGWRPWHTTEATLAEHAAGASPPLVRADTDFRSWQRGITRLRPTHQSQA
ncbi:hypothetical protein [Amycolatopsis sp. NPDC051903]|uniref:hypothetical protein n=1 Tax=Amycolatopsis sp. NPDC051903 TaxID=3363936 RepID=UPI0037B155E5